MLPPIFALLKAAPAVTAIVGTDPVKVFRHGAAPQGTVAPYVVWSVISDVPENNLSDLPPTDRVTVQVDCYHTTDAGIEQLAIAVRNALEPHGHMTGMPINQRETDTQLFRIALQFDLWVGR
ncbi:MAG: hypothetical protein K0S48_68 [Ramlibacter sp.]|jgi:hypothetical protein|nr:hypothetical protein [Ramlibacter sp.]